MLDYEISWYFLVLIQLKLRIALWRQKLILVPWRFYRRNHIYTRVWVKYLSVRRRLKIFFEWGWFKSIKRYLTHGFFVFVVRFFYQKWLIHLILDDKNIFDPRKWVIFVGKPYYKDNKPMGQVSFYHLNQPPSKNFFKRLLTERYLTHVRV